MPLYGQKKPTGRTAVYRVFNLEGELLYIGSSNNPRIRCYQHASTKRWWSEVASRTEEWFDTRVEAELVEKVAVGVEKPRYNVQHTPLHRKVSAHREEMTPKEAALWAVTRDKEPKNLGRKPWHLPWAGAARHATLRAKSASAADPDKPES